MTVAILDADIAAVYEWALSHARSRTRGDWSAADELADAATDAVLWSIQHCKDATTFRQFAKQAVRRWVGRQIGRIVKKRNNRPAGAPLPEQVEGREAKPVRPMLIEELPEDLAFLVRLYMVDGYTVREAGALCGIGHNTAARKLKQAAELLAAGRIAPERRKGEKRLSAG